MGTYRRGSCSLVMRAPSGGESRGRGFLHGGGTLVYNTRGGMSTS